MSAAKLTAAPLVEHSLEELKAQTKTLVSRGVTPSMKVILVGSNPASLIYTRNKKRFCEKFGALCEIINIDETITPENFIQEVQSIANDDSVHGCFVQLPLPKQLSHINVGELIPPNKDVDGFSGHNINALFMGDIGKNSLLPCTPKGIISLLEFNDIKISGKNVTIIGRSHIVGRPLSLLFTNHDATVTLCHSRTKNLIEHTKSADIIVSAVGIPRFLTKKYLNESKNQILIDVGINHDEDGLLCGDMDFENVKDHVASISPVPGGVGPLTILCLAQNLIQAAQKSLK